MIFQPSSKSKYAFLTSGKIILFCFNWIGYDLYDYHYSVDDFVETPGSKGRGDHEIPWWSAASKQTHPSSESAIHKHNAQIN